VISEFLKFCLSCFFFYRECEKREPATASYSALHKTSGNQYEEYEEYEEEKPEDVERAAWMRNEKLTRLAPSVYLDYFRNEMSWDLRLSFAQLALLYCLINNTVSVIQVPYNLLKL
jgi:hypothetical protein